MKKIILPRGKGKTTELIKLSAATQKYILVADNNRVQEISRMASKMKLDIPYPVTVEEYNRNHFKGSFIRKQGLLIDDVEDVMKRFLNGIEIVAMTITDEQEVQYEKDYDSSTSTHSHIDWV